MLFRTQQVLPVECLNVPTARFTVHGEGTSRSGGSLNLDRRKDYAVEVHADGYAAQVIRVESEVSFLRAGVSVVLNGGHGLLTFFISSIIGIPVDIAAGAWQVLEPTRIRVQLVPDGSAPAPAPQPQPPPISTTSWPAAGPPAPGTFCESCGARAGTTTFCTSCGGRVR